MLFKGSKEQKDVRRTEKKKKQPFQNNNNNSLCCNYKEIKSFFGNKTQIIEFSVYWIHHSVVYSVGWKSRWSPRQMISTKSNCSQEWANLESNQWNKVCVTAALIYIKHFRFVIHEKHLLMLTMPLSKRKQSISEDFVLRNFDLHKGGQGLGK